MFENPFKSSSKKSKEKAADKAKEYKKEKYKEKKTSRAEKRRERLQQWENMSEEERQEKYGDRYERAKELYDLEKSRIETVKLESEIINRDKITSKIWNAISFKDKKSTEELRKQYQEKIKEYQEKRAETISENVMATLNQNIKMAEQRALEHMSQSKFEKIKKGWKWLGDQNLEKLLKKFDKEPESWLGKTAARITSLKSLTTLGLMGVGAAGAGYLGGSIAYATRRSIGGAGATFMAYDWMKIGKEAKEMTFSNKDIKEMSEAELEEKMAKFESRATMNGENFQYDKNYKMLRKEYTERVESKSELTDALLRLDDLIREKDIEIEDEEINQKAKAITLGVITGGALSYGKISELIENNPQISEAFDSFLEKAGKTYDDLVEWFSDNPEEAKGAIENSPCMNKEGLQEATQDETTRKQEAVNTLDDGKVPADSSETSPESIPDNEKIETVDTKAIETISKGSNVWDTAQEMIKSGDITEEEFWEAWGNDNSTVELPSGREVHISELDLTHEGNQLVYIPGDGDTPPHFDVKNLSGEFSLGSSQDLYDTYKELGKEVPGWLEEAAKWDVTLDELKVTTDEYIKMTEDISLTNYEAESAAQEMKSIFTLTENIDKPLSEITFKEFKDVADSAGINMTYDRSKLYINFLQTLDESELLEYKDLSDITPKDIKDMDFGASQEIKRTIKDIANIEVLQEATKDMTGVTQETIQEAGENLEKNNIEVSEFDSAEFSEGATSEDVANTAESWNEAVKEAQESGIEIDNTATAVEISDGTFKIPAEGQFSEMIIKFTEAADGSIEGFTYKESIITGPEVLDNALKDNFRGIIRDNVGENYRSSYPNIVQNLAKNIKIQERILDTLEPDSKEFNFIKEAIEAKMNSIKKYGDVLK